MVSTLWVLYAIVLASYGTFAWATTWALAGAAVALAFSIFVYLLDVIRRNHTPGRFRAYPVWFRRFVRDS
jgi:hypothetical protein